MNGILFAKMDKVFSLKKNIRKNTGKWKSQGILLVRKSGNHDLAINCILSHYATMPKSLIIITWERTIFYLSCYHVSHILI